MLDLKAVGLKIKKEREKRNFTQEDLAFKAGISATHVSVIERGEKVAKLDTFVAIANALEVSADTLLADVVDYAVISEASELSMLISKEVPSNQKRIMRIVELLLNEK